VLALYETNFYLNERYIIEVVKIVRRKKIINVYNERHFKSLKDSKNLSKLQFKITWSVFT